MTVDDLVDAWHESDSSMGCHQWLGLTWVEYMRWVRTGVLPDGWEPPPGRTGE